MRGLPVFVMNCLKALVLRPRLFCLRAVHVQSPHEWQDNGGIMNTNTSCKFFIDNIKPTDKSAYEKAKSHLDNLAKPPGSLGKLEEIAAKLCAIAGSQTPTIDKRCVIITAADNGVVDAGVSSAPQAVTAVQTINIVNGVTGVGVMAKAFRTDLIVADVGVNAELSHPLLLDRKVRKSTGNITLEPAMSRAEAEAAIAVGIGLAEAAKSAGYELIGVGEMGIGNTTTSSAVLSALLGLSGNDIDSAVGKGAGLNHTAYEHKINVIKASLALHKPDGRDPVDVLYKVGGLDLAAMTGVFIGAAYYGLPVVIDGFISAVAALCAARLNPLTKEYMFASHLSAERGYTPAINALGLSPCLDLGMRLGEGSGCPLMFGVMDAALAAFKDMATFGEANIGDDYLDNIREIETSSPKTNHDRG